MKTIFLSLFSLSSLAIYTTVYAQSEITPNLYHSSIKTLQKTMPHKATIDGKRISSVSSPDDCSVIVARDSKRQYQFSLTEWPKQGHVDETGYTVFILEDTDQKPHILRTDEIKGKVFLLSIDALVKNCLSLKTQNSNNTETP